MKDRRDDREADEVLANRAQPERGIPHPRRNDIPLQKRKAPLDMRTQPERETRRLKAAIIGFGLDGWDGDQQRISTGDQCVLLGGSAETHAEMLETMLRLESELDRCGRTLSELNPSELADLAWRIDSPELHAIAVRLHEGLEESGRAFHELSADELTDLAAETGSAHPA